MKRNIEKIFATAGFVVALILIVILIVAAFGGITEEDFNNNLVKGLFITLGALYIVLTLVAVVGMFIDEEAVKQIVLRSNKDGTTRVTIGVIRKMVKNGCASIEGVKCNKIGLTCNEYGVRLKISVKVVDKDVEQVEAYIRRVLEDEFYNALGFKFHAIEIQFISLQPSYTVNTAAVIAAADKALADKKAEDAEAVLRGSSATDEKAEDAKVPEELVEQPVPSDNALDVQPVEELNVAAAEEKVDAETDEAVKETVEDTAEEKDVEEQIEEIEQADDAVEDAAEDENK